MPQDRITKRNKTKASIAEKTKRKMAREEDS
jgi:hypothetical protein